jgi:hypothetical protein
VQENSVPPVKLTLWIVSVGAVSDCSGDVHRSSRRVWAKCLQHRLDQQSKKKASVHWYFIAAQQFLELKMAASVKVISTVEPTVHPLKASVQ